MVLIVVKLHDILLFYYYESTLVPFLEVTENL